MQQQNMIHVGIQPWALNRDPRYKRTVGQAKMSLICHQQRTRQELLMSDRKLIYRPQIKFFSVLAIPMF